ncbi:AcrR family transcriptional regulator [Crossiella equi]|uniref:AcrR family transcriptional regulator n=1 Tax=Crossiella equi TaxID=130796 RepID=A0ABS5AF17_9PSEU|nr:TetR/AcrR family transcriptional regulator [Crossiella equi]MBP2474912.1 AcrR family transcriptional regulator [Crossiella equi]
MARSKDPAVRALLLERAAQQLRAREPITLRSLVAGTGVSTMAVYTYFGGMDGLWQALRQEGFTRLAERYEAMACSEDPVADLTALTAGYVGNALAHPDLYRVMFDTSAELTDLAAANATLAHLDRAVARAVADKRFRAVKPRELAVRTWTIAHGLVSLVANGPLPDKTLANGIPLLTALFTFHGDEPEACARSVASGWARLATDEVTS